MDHERARALLAAERGRLEEALRTAVTDGADQRGTQDTGDSADAADRLNDEATADALVAALNQELAAVERAERRLADGTYGRSVASGAVIPDDRLEADPAAELTAAEAGELSAPGRPGD